MHGPALRPLKQTKLPSGCHEGQLRVFPRQRIQKLANGCSCHVFVVLTPLRKPNMTSSLSRSPHQCPRCHVPLLLGTAADMSMHGCPSCGGIWLGSACAKRFSMALPKEALALAKKHAKSALGRVDTAPNIQCPVCNSDMQRTHIAAAQLEVDGCGAHGVWYDRNEMQSIARAMAKLNWQPSPETAAALGVAAVEIPAGVAVAQAEASRSINEI